MNIPPLTPRTLAAAFLIALAIYLVMLVLPGGPLHPAPRYNCTEHGFIGCCFN